ncbi:alpha/beta hydrolase [Lentzea cavernae]|uniref:Alpha/beta hydrolase n=1 Tax=Lentzea cavernae TaxID=2020703 RepID=A0ABQ3M3L1_9PSEU|nr:alpha/beta hydrolase [Lentzea cavernae]
MANPLRGLTADGEYVASQAAQVDGDVLLVGHSYGGPVITYAGGAAGNVKGLVFVAAFALDKGENALNATQGYPDTGLGEALRPWTYPGSELPEFTLAEDKYREIFAADVTDEEAAIGAVSQRPAAAVAFGEPLSVEPSWKSLPTWWVLPTADHTIPTEYQVDAAKRVDAVVTVVEGGSHSIAVSRPDEVADAIINAAGSLS